MAKLNPTGTALLYSTYLGGSGEDYASAIAVDSAGRATVVGATCSTDFPVTPGAFQKILKSPCPGTFNGNIFITRLSATGSALIASTYLGGTGQDFSGAAAIDSSGNVYVDGWTVSTDFPTTTGVVQTTFRGIGVVGFGDGFVTKLNPNLSALIYSTYLGGSGDDFLGGLAIDAAGNAFVAGDTNSTDFPVTAGAFQTTFGGNGTGNFGDTFVTKLNPTATALVYSTYLGGTGDDFGDAIAIDKFGNAYVTGDTTSSDFPVTPTAYQVVYGGTGTQNFGDAFVTKLNVNGSKLIYSTFIGGDQDESGSAIAVDHSGGAIVVGSTTSDDFPTTSNGLQRFYGGPALATSFTGDVYITRLNATGTALTFSTFLGGAQDDAPGGVALDGTGNAYIIGDTISPDFPTTAGAYDTSCGTDGLCNGGALDAFAAKIQLP